MKLSSTKCNQSTCFLCQSVLKGWQPLISLNKKNFEFKKGQQIFKEGDPVKGIYFIYDGKVKVHKYWDEEKEFIVRFANKGDILGHLGLWYRKFLSSFCYRIRESYSLLFRNGFFRIHFRSEY